jgi:hypothetical protein
MGKTKTLLEPGVTKSETPELKSSIVKCKAVEIALADALLAYLGTKPHNEVAQLVFSLSSSPAIDVTVTQAPNGN